MKKEDYMIEQLAKYKAKEFDTKNIFLFFLIAFGWTWFWWFLFILGVFKMPAGVGTPDIDLGTAGPILLIVILSPFGPTIGGFVVTALSTGRTGVRNLWKQFWNRNLKIKWLLIIVFFYPLLYLFSRYCSQLFFGLQQPPMQLLSTPWLIIPPFIASILNGGLSEEFGWRGYALRHFQSKWNALTSALILGFFEGCWHIPLIFMPDDMRFGMPILVLVLPYFAVGVIRAWVYNNTNGSVLAAVLFHAVGNVTGEVVPFNPPSIFFFYIIEFFVALAIIILFKPKILIRDKVVADTLTPQ